jgi:hypothetical protein
MVSRNFHDILLYFTREGISQVVMNNNHSAFQGGRIILSDLNKNRVECSIPVSPHENAYIKTQNLCLEEQENMP